MDRSYTDFHRRFLRKITAKGFLSLEAAQGYYNDLRSEFPDAPEMTMDTAIQQINNSLKLFDQQLAMIKQEQFDEEYVVLSTIVPLDTALITQQKTMRPNDFKYFEAVLRAVLDSNEFKLRYKMALTTQVQSNRRSVSGDNEHMLKMWTSLGYFKVVDGVVYLGPKSLVEFKGYIHSEYPDIENCALCFSLTFLNNKCHNCQKNIHQPCLERFWRAMPNACPSCRVPWKIEDE